MCSVEKATLVPLLLPLFVVVFCSGPFEKGIQESSHLKMSYVGCTVRFASYSRQDLYE